MDRRTSHVAAFGLGFLTGALLLAVVMGLQLRAYSAQAELSRQEAEAERDRAVAARDQAVAAQNLAADAHRVAAQCRAEANSERMARARVERELEEARNRLASKR
jgi:hypothetical protein